MGLVLASFCGLLVCGVAGASERLWNSELLAAAQGNPEAEFRTWVHKYSKPYASDEAEYQRRFSIWKKNLKFIQDYNQKHDTHWLGLNLHADMTNEEFKSSRLGLDVELAKNHPRQEFELSATNIPDAIDWREKKAVTKVKNQSRCGACWAFSTTGAIEGINAIYSGSLVSLSEQELVDCDVGLDHGCHGGLMDHAFNWVIKNGGIDTEEDYKYHAKEGVCNVARENRHVITIDGYNDVPTNRSLQLQAAVAKQPVAIAIQANQRPFQLYAGGVFTAECGIGIDHGVLLVGYGTENNTAYWLVKNSWGPDWGDAGYIKLERDLIDGSAGKCGVALMPSYPVKTSANPPKPPRPAPMPPTPPPAPPGKCDEHFSCAAGTTCCCMYHISANQCLQWSCCPYPEATCCEDHYHCCPHDYPVCDLEHLRCTTGKGAGVAGLRGSGGMATTEPDFLSVALGENVPAIPNPFNRLDTLAQDQDTLAQEVVY